MNTHRLLAHAAVVAAAVVTVAGPAGAQTITGTDPGNDMGHRADIQSVTVTNGDDIQVRIEHRDLVSDGLVGGRVYFDVDPDRSGPEYVLLAGFYDGTDYQMFHARQNWSVKGQPLSDCDYRLRLKYARDTSVVTVDPPCFGDPEAVRVGVRLSADTSDGVKVDWFKGVQRFTRFAHADS